MAHSIFQVPYPTNEPILTYAPGSAEKKEVLKMYSHLYKANTDIPMRIGDRDVQTGITANMHPPHDHKHSLGTYHKAEAKHIKEAIQASLDAKNRLESNALGIKSVNFFESGRAGCRTFSSKN